MTTIVAAELGDEVVWAWDSQVSYGGGGHAELDYDKVFPNGDLVIGLAGSLADSQALRYTKMPTLDTWDVDRWVTEKVTKKWKKTMKNHGSTIIEVNNRLYEVDPYGSWVRNTSGVYAIGSGANFALGALLQGARPHEALVVASQLDMYTGGDIIMATSTEIREGFFELAELEDKKPKKKKKGKKNENG